MGLNDYYASGTVHCIISALAVIKSKQNQIFPLKKFRNTGNQTRASWVGSANAITVLCRASIVIDSLIVVSVTTESYTLLNDVEMN